MRNINLHMQDAWTGKDIFRTIDITNAMSNGSTCWELRGKDAQRENLESWIKERGNDQHNTDLELIDWTIS